MTASQTAGAPPRGRAALLRELSKARGSNGTRHTGADTRPEIGERERARPQRREARFTQSVLDYSRAHRWIAHHSWDSRKSTGNGLPDILMVRPHDRRFIAAELKVGNRKRTASQIEWGDALEAVAAASGGHVEYHIWRPEDWPEIERVLAYEPKGER